MQFSVDSIIADAGLLGVSSSLYCHMVALSIVGKSPVEINVGRMDLPGDVVTAALLKHDSILISLLGENTKDDVFASPSTAVALGSLVVGCAERPASRATFYAPGKHGRQIPSVGTVVEV